MSPPGIGPRPVHLVFGTSGSAPAWFAQALEESGAMDSRRIAGVWVHVPADAPARLVAPHVNRALRDEHVLAGGAHRTIAFRVATPRVPDHVPQDLLDGA